MIDHYNGSKSFANAEHHAAVLYMLWQSGAQGSLPVVHCWTCAAIRGTVKPHAMLQSRSSTDTM